MPLPNEILEQLPEDLRGNETLNRYNSLEDLAKGLVETKSLVGSSIRIPQAEAGEEARQEFIQKLMNNAPELMIKPSPESPEQSNEFWRTLGYPEKPEGYSNPEDLKLNPDLENELRTVLHGAQATNDQYQKIMAAFASRETELQANMEAQRQEQEDALKGKWGQTYEERLGYAKKIHEENFPDVPFEQIAPNAIEGLYNVHVAINGQKPQAPSQPDPTGKLPPDEALRRANEIMNNPEYWDQSNPNQQALIKKRVEYLKMAGMSDNLDELRPRSFG